MKHLGRHERTDERQAFWVQQIRDAKGFSVMVNSGAGHGLPDLIVGHAGRTHLVEIKSEGGSITLDQFHRMRAWTGSEWIIETTPTAAIEEIRRMDREER